jgi:hypothetical protein
MSDWHERLPIICPSFSSQLEQQSWQRACIGSGFPSKFRARIFVSIRLSLYAIYFGYLQLQQFAFELAD